MQVKIKIWISLLLAEAENTRRWDYHNTAGPGPINILQHKFYATLIF